MCAIYECLPNLPLITLASHLQADDMTQEHTTRRVSQLCKPNGAEDDRRLCSFKLAPHCATHF